MPETKETHNQRASRDAQRSIERAYQDTINHFSLDTGPECETHGDEVTADYASRLKKIIRRQAKVIGELSQLREQLSEQIDDLEDER